MDRTLANGKQSIISYEKQRATRVDRPVHLNAFILAYSKVIMNNFIDGFGGFDHWNKTFTILTRIRFISTTIKFLN
jgi:hypothetical protein